MLLKPSLCNDACNRDSRLSLILIILVMADPSLLIRSHFPSTNVVLRDKWQVAILKLDSSELAPVKASLADVGATAVKLTPLRRSSLSKGSDFSNRAGRDGDRSSLLRDEVGFKPSLCSLARVPQHVFPSTRSPARVPQHAFHRLAMSLH